jgi:hypothetical protein
MVSYPDLIRIFIIVSVSGKGKNSDISLFSHFCYKIPRSGSGFDTVSAKRGSDCTKCQINPDPKILPSARQPFVNDGKKDLKKGRAQMHRPM